jgi:peptidyl-prolyl cis-trans isomerase A (cyclophilin A)
MIRRLALGLIALFALLAPLGAPALAAPGPGPGIVKVALKTSLGTIVIAVDQKHAPITAGNFLAYVDQKKLDGVYFYRAARAAGNPKRGFIQGGIRKDMRRALPPIKHEPTTKTGLSHIDGAISMARREPGSAMGEFFIMVGASPSMDANPKAKGDNAGYAVFGRVVQGMPVVKKILASKNWPGGSGSMEGQMIKDEVKIIEAKRI